MTSNAIDLLWDILLVFHTYVMYLNKCSLQVFG